MHAVSRTGYNEVMEYRTLGETGIRVSRIGFGVLTVGATQLALSVEESGDLIRYAWQQGINFFDTAQYYKTYPHLADGLAKIERQRLGAAGGRMSSLPAPVICSKSLDPTAQGMTTAIAEARSALKRDTIDIFLLHEVRPGDFSLRSGAWEALKEAKAKGWVRTIGISTHHVDVAESMLDVPSCDVVFPLINKEGLGIRCGDGPGTPAAMADVIRRLHEAGKGIFSMKVFGGGNLTGRYIECLDYVSHLPGVDSMMIGFGRKTEVDDAAAYIEGRLADDYQPDISRKKIHIDSGDCEGCGRCIKRCPNHAIFMTRQGIASVDPHRCLTCGYCAPVCPVRAILLL